MLKNSKEYDLLMKSKRETQKSWENAINLINKNLNKFNLILNDLNENKNQIKNSTQENYIKSDVESGYSSLRKEILDKKFNHYIIFTPDNNSSLEKTEKLISGSNKELNLMNKNNQIKFLMENNSKNKKIYLQDTDDQTNMPLSDKERLLVLDKANAKPNFKKIKNKNFYSITNQNLMGNIGLETDKTDNKINDKVKYNDCYADNTYKHAYEKSEILNTTNDIMEEEIHQQRENKLKNISELAGYNRVVEPFCSIKNDIINQNGRHIKLSDYLVKESDSKDKPARGLATPLAKNQESLKKKNLTFGEKKSSIEVTNRDIENYNKLIASNKNFKENKNQLQQNNLENSSIYNSNDNNYNNTYCNFTPSNKNAGLCGINIYAYNNKNIIETKIHNNKNTHYYNNINNKASNYTNSNNNYDNNNNNSLKDNIEIINYKNNMNMSKQTQCNTNNIVNFPSKENLLSAINNKLSKNNFEYERGMHCDYESNCISYNKQLPASKNFYDSNNKKNNTTNNTKSNLLNEELEISSCNLKTLKNISSINNKANFNSNASSYSKNAHLKNYLNNINFNSKDSCEQAGCSSRQNATLLKLTDNLQNASKQGLNSHSNNCLTNHLKLSDKKNNYGCAEANQSINVNNSQKYLPHYNFNSTNNKSVEELDEDSELFLNSNLCPMPEEEEHNYTKSSDNELSNESINYNYYNNRNNNNNNIDINTNQSSYYNKDKTSSKKVELLSNEGYEKFVNKVKSSVFISNNNSNKLSNLVSLLKQEVNEDNNNNNNNIDRINKPIINSDNNKILNLKNGRNSGYLSNHKGNIKAMDKLSNTQSDEAAQDHLTSPNKGSSKRQHNVPLGNVHFEDENMRKANELDKQGPRYSELKNNHNNYNNLNDKKKFDYSKNIVQNKLYSEENKHTEIIPIKAAVMLKNKNINLNCKLELNESILASVNTNNNYNITNININNDYDNNPFESDLKQINAPNAAAARAIVSSSKNFLSMHPQEQDISLNSKFDKRQNQPIITVGYKPNYRTLTSNNNNNNKINNNKFSQSEEEKQRINKKANIIQKNLRGFLFRKLYKKCIAKYEKLIHFINIFIKIKDNKDFTFKLEFILCLKRKLMLIKENSLKKFSKTINEIFTKRLKFVYDSAFRKIYLYCYTNKINQELLNANNKNKILESQKIIKPIFSANDTNTSYKRRVNAFTQVNCNSNSKRDKDNDNVNNNNSSKINEMKLFIFLYNLFSVKSFVIKSHFFKNMKNLQMLSNLKNKNKLLNLKKVILYMENKHRLKDSAGAKAYYLKAVFAYWKNTSQKENYLKMLKEFLLKKLLDKKLKIEASENNIKEYLQQTIHKTNSRRSIRYNKGEIGRTIAIKIEKDNLYFSKFKECYSRLVFYISKKYLLEIECENKQRRILIMLQKFIFNKHSLTLKLLKAGFNKFLAIVAKLRADLTAKKNNSLKNLLCKVSRFALSQKGRELIRLWKRKVSNIIRIEKLFKKIIFKLEKSKQEALSVSFLKHKQHTKALANKTKNLEIMLQKITNIFLKNKKRSFNNFIKNIRFIWNWNRKSDFESNKISVSKIVEINCNIIFNNNNNTNKEDTNNLLQVEDKPNDEIKLNKIFMFKKINFFWKLCEKNKTFILRYYLYKFYNNVNSQSINELKASSLEWNNITSYPSNAKNLTKIIAIEEDLETLEDNDIHQVNTNPRRENLVFAEKENQLFIPPMQGINFHIFYYHFLLSIIMIKVF